MANSESPQSPQRRPRFQFGPGALLLAMVLVSVAAAGLGGMLRREFIGAPLTRAIVVLMIFAAPIGAMILISLVRSAVRRLMGSRPRR
jgi:hypothetical protein